MRRNLRVLAAASLAVGLSLSLTPAATAAPADAGTGRYPTSFDLPIGFRPEGIATGPGPHAYVGSLRDGAIYRADLRTGTGRVISPGVAGTQTVGIKTDHRGRLFAAGGGGGGARVVAVRTGAVLATYTFTTAPTFVNDVVLTPRAAYFTDSRRPVLYKLPLGRHGELPATFETISLTGPIVVDPQVNNLNGIARTPDGRALLAVQTNTGTLWRIDPSTGAVRAVDVGVQLTYGDGLLVIGRTLYVVQNRANVVTVIRLDRAGTAGVVVGSRTNSSFDVPTTAARFGNRLYLPNARFNTVDDPNTAEYRVVSVRR